MGLGAPGGIGPGAPGTGAGPSGLGGGIGGFSAPGLAGLGGFGEFTAPTPSGKARGKTDFQTALEAMFSLTPVGLATIGIAKGLQELGATPIASPEVGQQAGPSDQSVQRQRKKKAKPKAKAAPLIPDLGATLLTDSLLEDRFQTLLTSPLGLTGQPTLFRKTLLGS